jgi:hypothetical protein
MEDKDLLNRDCTALGVKDGRREGGKEGKMASAC